MHVTVIMNTASGVRTRRADLIRFLQSIGHIVTVVSATDRTADDLRTMGVTFVHWPISRQGLNPFAEALSLLSLRNILFHLQPHVILCFTLKAVLYGSLAARTIPRSTVFSVFAGLGHLFSDDCSMLLPFRPLIQTVFRYALKNNPVVFFQNPDDLELFVTRGIVPQRRTYRLYGSGVDTARFSPNSDRVPSARTTFIMIARLIRPKGILDYIQAATILKREGYDVRALLLGPFDDHPTAIDAYTITHRRLLASSNTLAGHPTSVLTSIAPMYSYCHHTTVKELLGRPSKPWQWGSPLSQRTPPAVERP